MTDMFPMDPLDVSRFWSNVNVQRDVKKCWEWLGSSSGGYGRFSVGGREIKAHRVSLILSGRVLPEGHVVRHHCDNPSCVNPSHLDTGTHRQNTMDKFDRGRGSDRKGEKHPLVKLTDDQVRDIRKKAMIGWSESSLGKEYGVCRAQIWRIKNGKAWSHIV